MAEDEDFEPRVPVTNEPVPVAEGKLPEWMALVSKSVVPPTGDRGFESFFLQRRVYCEPDFRRRIPSMTVGDFGSAKKGDAKNGNGPSGISGHRHGTARGR